MISTKDAYSVPRRKSSISSSSRSSNAHSALNSLDLSLKTKVSVGSKNASKVVQTTMEAQTMKRLFCPIKHLKGPKEQETVEKGNAFNDSNVMFYWFLMVCRSFQGILSTGRLWGTTTWYWRCSTLLPANGSTCGISSSVDVMSQLDSLASQVEVLWVGRWLGERPKCSSKEQH